MGEVTESLLDVEGQVVVPVGLIPTGQGPHFYQLPFSVTDNGNGNCTLNVNVTGGSTGSGSSSGGAIGTTSAPNISTIKDASTSQQATVESDGSLKVDASAHTQPVSGTVAVSSLPGTPAQTADIAAIVTKLSSTLIVQDTQTESTLSSILVAVNRRSTANLAVPAGATAGTNSGTGQSAVVASANAGHLYSIVVEALPQGTSTAATRITDGQGGPLLATIPASFPGGEILISSSKFFGTSIYCNTTSTSPAFTIGYGP